MEQMIDSSAYESLTTSVHPLKEIKITTSDNLHLHGWHLSARVPAIGNIILVHGFKDQSERYLDFAQKLTYEGYEVFGFDLRGHAKSQGERAYFEGIDVIMQDFKSVINTFKQSDNRKPWILMGQSAGAALTARFVLDNPKMVDGFILSSPYLARGSKINFLTEGALKLASIITPRAKMMNLPARTAAVMIENVDYVQSMKRKNKLPFLVLHGRADKINNIEGSKEFFAGIPTSPLQGKIIYPTLNHNLLHGLKHERVENDILNWLEQFIKSPVHH